jgi:hypothetical protein
MINPFTRKLDSAHIMLDLETLGRNPGCVILQIGACRFNPAKGIISTFSRSIDIRSSISKGFTVDGETISWWFEQEDAARKSVIDKTVPITTALNEFSKFVGNDGDILWSHKDFDASILKEAYGKLNIPFPVGYRNIYDLRTLTGIAKLMKISTNRTREGVYHTALDDAIYQAGIASDFIMEMISR